MFEKKGIVTVSSPWMSLICWIWPLMLALMMWCWMSRARQKSRQPGSFVAVKQALDQSVFVVAQAEVMEVADTAVPVDVAGAQTLLKLIDVRRIDDVQEVSTNAEIADEVMAQIAESDHQACCDGGSLLVCRLSFHEGECWVNARAKR